MHNLTISSVSYLNALPFNYGIKNSGFLNNVCLQTDVPAECARKLFEDEVDIALVPVGAMLNKPNLNIISNFCIGATNEVASVILAGNTNFNEIKKIYLDNDSRTSALLIRIIANLFWKIKVEWITKNIALPFDDDDNHLLAIGDKTFELKNKYKYIYDLASEWKKFTNLDFVFAVWLTKKEIPANIVQNLNLALEWGCKQKQKAIKESEVYKNKYCNTDLIYYIENNISYTFDDNKKKGLELFFKLANQLELS